MLFTRSERYHVYGLLMLDEAASWIINGMNEIMQSLQVD